MALANLDEVIATIRSSRTVETARRNLRRRFKLTEAQAQAILDMPLRRLAALERKKIETEHKETLRRIKVLESLLRSPKKILAVIKQDLLDLRANYDSPRRTHIVAGERGHLTTRDLVPEEDVVLAVSRNGRICRWPADRGFEPARGRQKDPLLATAIANTRDNVYLFSEDGKAVVVPAHQIPPGTAPGQGLPIAELAGLSYQPNIVAVLALERAGPAKAEKTVSLSGYLFLASHRGRVKRVALADLVAARTAEITIMKLEEGDKLGWAALTAGNQEVVIIVSNGQAIRFSEEEVRPMGLPAGGVLGVKMAGEDQVVGMGVYRPRGDVVVISEMGIGKRSSLSDYPGQGRYGAGVATANLSATTGQLAAGIVANASDRLLMVSERGKGKAMYVRSLPKAGRATQGKELIAIRGRDRLATLLALSLVDAEKAKPTRRRRSSGAPTGGQRRRSTGKSRPASSAASSPQGRKRSTSSSGSKTSRARSGRSSSGAPPTGRGKKSTGRTSRTASTRSSRARTASPSTAGKKRSSSR